MDYYEIENIFVQFLKDRLQEKLSVSATDRGTFGIDEWQKYLGDKVGYNIHQFEHLEALEIVYDFLSRNIISIGADWVNKDIPFFRITEYGKKLIEEDSMLPFDPDGYLEEFSKRVPGLNELVYKYLGEAIQAYHRFCLLSSITMLGVASECLFLDLTENLSEWMKTNKNDESLEGSLRGKGIYRNYRELKKTLEKIKEDIPEELKKDMESHIDNTFNYIRMCRNEAGHPTGKEINKRELYAHLQAFDRYATYISNLMNHFR